jgi:cation diffusion facilitator family transporter
MAIEKNKRKMRVQIALISGCNCGGSCRCSDSSLARAPEFEEEFNTKHSGLHRRALFLSYFTVGYNFLEGLASIFAGLLAGSIALVGFGLDSFVESLSGGVMIWRFRKHGKVSEDEEAKIEAKATKFVAIAFFVLGAYVLYESSKKLYFQEVPQPSMLGIVIAIISIVVMPILFYLKYKTGKAIGSRSLLGDSKQTLACVFLSVALLLGLGFNYLYGLWWADPMVGFIIVVFLIREGYSTLKEARLCSC